MWLRSVFPIETTSSARCSGAYVQHGAPRGDDGLPHDDPPAQEAPGQQGLRALRHGGRRAPGAVRPKQPGQWAGLQQTSQLRPIQSSYLTNFVAVVSRFCIATRRGCRNGSSSKRTSRINKGKVSTYNVEHCKAPLR